MEHTHTNKKKETIFVTNIKPDFTKDDLTNTMADNKKFYDVKSIRENGETTNEGCVCVCVCA